MKRRLTCLFISCLLLGSNGTTLAKGQDSERPRTFEFTYQVTLQPAPKSTLKVWIPIATSDANQQVVLKDISSPVRPRMKRDKAYGNHILYAEIKDARAPVRLALRYEVTRHEYSRGSLDDLMRYNRNPDPAPPGVARFLEPDRLVPNNDTFRTLAAQIAQGKSGDVEKAHAIYDYVCRTLRYDKSGTGWGRGDALWVCAAKHGNCTDFHSLFIALMRAENIPARFEIGFPLPEGKSEGEIPGYHCWAEFYALGLGWVPVDISEAWKNPTRHDFFFGSLDVNRVQFSVGRDLTLNPPQSGSPVNYFVYPYVERNGQPYDRFEKRFWFRELSAPASAALPPSQLARARGTR